MAWRSRAASVSGWSRTMLRSCGSSGISGSSGAHASPRAMRCSANAASPKRRRMPDGGRSRKPPSSKMPSRASVSRKSASQAIRSIGMRRTAVALLFRVAEDGDLHDRSAPPRSTRSARSRRRRARRSPPAADRCGSTRPSRGTPGAGAPAPRRPARRSPARRGHAPPRGRRSAAASSSASISALISAGEITPARRSRASDSAPA